MVTRRKRARGGAPANTPATQPVTPPATFAPAFHAGFQATASRVQEMHQAIAGKTFDNLLRVPGLSVPTRIVQGVHDAITHGVYAAVRHGGGAALALAGHAERHAIDPARVPGPREQALRSAVNAAVGDELQASGSALAIRMGFHADGAAVAPTSAALRALPARVAVFIHGLACDERSWAQRTEAWRDSPWADALPAGVVPQYGALLARELGIGTLYLRYNTGLSLDDNGHQLAALLARAGAAAPQVHEWLLIGHSMGGLVARRAHALGVEQAWAARAKTIICLGSPHQGAPLEQFGLAATNALHATDVTRPLARIANARSRGIKDLRHGLQRHVHPAQAPALRMVYATLGDEADRGVGALIGRLFGDGLVMPGSAADRGLGGDVERVELAGMGHMGLLNHPRVYAVLRRWLGAPELSAASPPAHAG